MAAGRHARWRGHTSADDEGLRAEERVHSPQKVAEYDAAAPRGPAHGHRDCQCRDRPGPPAPRAPRRPPIPPLAHNFWRRTALGWQRRRTSANWAVHILHIGILICIFCIFCILFCIFCI